MAERDGTATTTREACYARYLALDALFPAGRFEPHWTGAASLWFLVDGDDGPAFLHVDLDSGRRLGPLSIERLRAEAAWPVARVFPTDEGLRFECDAGPIEYHAAPDRFVAHSWPPVRRPGTFERRLVLAMPTQVPDRGSPDGTRFATVVNGDVQVVDRRSGHATPLTDDAADGVAWELESGRRPFARVKAVDVDPWSPDGRTLVAARIDLRGVPAVPLIDFLGPDIAIDAFLVERPAQPLARNDFAFLDVDDGTRRTIELGDTRDVLIVPVGWMPDASGYWFVRGSRDLTRIEVLEAGRDGGTRVVLTESGPTFMRIQHNLLYPNNAGCVLLPDSTGFLWLSERSGWNHIHVVAREDGAIRALTHGAWPVLAIEFVDARARVVWFTAHDDPDRPYDVHLCRVPLDGGAIERVTRGPGQRDIAFSPSGRWFVETVSTTSRPPVTTARSLDGTRTDVLRRVDLAPLLAIGWRAPEEVVVRTADGLHDLWGVLYLPADFDPSHRYPVVESIYAGPQVAFADRSFPLGHAYKPWNLPLALAQLGFAVVVIDGTGTPERSKAFHDTIVGHWGTRQLVEHAHAIRTIASTRPFMDTERTGIFGHSWGGFAAFRALVDAPDLYKAAVASGSAFDADNVMSEPYLGSDPTAESYRRYDAVARAKDVDGALMIVAGTAEVSMFHGAMRMTHALVEAGIRHQLIVLPGQPHGYSGAAADYVLDATTRFFQRHLGDDRTGPA